jgi:hypothetical protein
MWCLAKNCCTIGPNAQACCCDEFAAHQTNIFLVTDSKLHHEDVLIFLNKNACLQFHFVECIHAAQYLLDKKKQQASPLTCIKTWCAFLGH